MRRFAAACWILIACALVIACVLCLASCAPVPGPACVSACGLRLMAPAPWSCSEFQDAEDHALEAFQAVTDPRFAHACTRISAYSVRVTAGATFPDATGRQLDGLTYCEHGAIYVGNVPPRRGALAHELAHAVQSCDPPDHRGWDTNGITDALRNR